MVGLRLRSGYQVEEGQDLAEEVVPWAAALSDLLLPSHCAACFRPCSATRFPCPGPCQGALLYCSPTCGTVDLPLHTRSAECKLLALLRSSSSPATSSGFPSLGGTCDIRTALRLLAQHYSLNHVTSFLAASRCAYGANHPRLGGLLSNRSSLLQNFPPNDEDEGEDEELCLARELGEAARLMYHVRYTMPAVRHACQSSIHTLDDQAVHTNDLYEDAEGQVGDAYMTDRNTNADVCPHVPEWPVGGSHLDSPGEEHANEHEVLQENAWAADTNQIWAASEHLHTSASAHAHAKVQNINGKAPVLTQAGEMLLVQEVLCQVFTNGVRIHMDSSTADEQLNVQSTDLGTAVYGPSVSWINHSCRPNAFFSFVIAGQVMSRESTYTAPLDPDMDVKGLEDTWGLRSAFPWSARADDQGPYCLQYYSPRARLRAIRNIKGLEPVFISYIDLLQPKEMRRQELWLKYRFHCNCERCEMKPTEGVDGILQQLGSFVNQSESPILEELLSKEAQRGFKEFLENDNPLSCCEILEGAMLKLLHYAYQSHMDVKSPHFCQLQESLNHGEHQCLEASTTHRRHMKLHLMHHVCLNIYMILSSSYKLLAMGFNNSGVEDISTGSAAARSIRVSERREVECSIASAAYSVVQATTIQCLCDLGEAGLLAISARFWQQNWEGCINLILKLDSYFHLDSSSEMQSILLMCISEFKRIISLPDDNFICKLKDLLSTCESLKNCHSTSQLFWFSATALWPFLRCTSPFLSNIETPFDISEVCISTVEKQTGLVESIEDWLCYRGEALICALCSLRYSFRLKKMLYGSGDELVKVMQDSSLFFQQTVSPVVQATSGP